MGTGYSVHTDADPDKLWVYFISEAARLSPNRISQPSLWAHDRVLVHNITETGPPILKLNLDLHLPNIVLIFILVLVTHVHTTNIQCMQTLVLYSSLSVKSTVANTKFVSEGRYPGTSRNTG